MSTTRSLRSTSDYQTVVEEGVKDDGDGEDESDDEDDQLKDRSILAFLDGQSSEVSVKSIRRWYWEHEIFTERRIMFPFGSLKLSKVVDVFLI